MGIDLRPGFVEEGQFIALPLQLTDETLPIDPDASSITHLAVTACGQRVIGATEGTACHLFAAYFKAATGGVVDLGAIGGATDDATDVVGLVPVDGRARRELPAVLAVPGADRLCDQRNVSVGRRRESTGRDTGQIACTRAV